MRHPPHIQIHHPPPHVGFGAQTHTKLGLVPNSQFWCPTLTPLVPNTHTFGAQHSHLWCPKLTLLQQRHTLSLVEEWRHDLMASCSRPPPHQYQQYQYQLQKLRQCVCVAGASVTCGGGMAIAGERWWCGRGWNVGRRRCGGGGGVDQGCGGVAPQCQQFWGVGVGGGMWRKRDMVMMERRRRGHEEEAGSLCLGIFDSIRNLIRCCGSACSGDLRTWIPCGGGCTKVMSSGDRHQSTSDLVIERNMTDLCWLGKDVTVSCASDYTNAAGRELQTEAIADADNLQQNIRRPFILVWQIVGSRVSLYDQKFYSATSKAQVIDAQSLRLMEGCSAKSSHPNVLQHRQPCLCRGFFNGSLLFQSFMVLSWRSIWTLWHYFLLLWIKSVFSISISLINV